MDVDDTLARLKGLARAVPVPTFSREQVRAWEEEFRVRLPEAYGRVVTQGSYDMVNFYFVDIHEPEKFPGFLVFARWNDDLFAFPREMADDATAPVFLLLEGFEPLAKYPDFAAWFESVFEMSIRPVNPE